MGTSVIISPMSPLSVENLPEFTLNPMGHTDGHQYCEDVFNYGSVYKGWVDPKQGAWTAVGFNVGTGGGPYQ